MRDLKIRLKMDSNPPYGLLTVIEKLIDLLEALQRDGIINDFGIMIDEQFP